MPDLITQDTLDMAALQKPQGHKYDHGHVLVLSGGTGRTGAARMAARAALRIGAGAVSLGVPPAAQMEVAGHITAEMILRIADASQLQANLDDSRLNAVCLGPGFGVSDEKRDLIEVALKSGRAAVLDADALTLVAAHPALFEGLHTSCVLTPHGGEFARLFPDIAQEDPVQAASMAARRAGCTVLLKGPNTAIANASGKVWVHQATGDRAVPWLATAGAGDVLAGFIAGLLARGFTPWDAARYAAFIHVECALACGPGLIATDLPEALPGVLRSLIP